ncbi:SusC/RagA family TonB-linked outer membrane protein [Flavihumibacter solisilvae]|uniref:TonB-dependent receptor n=1 Tax=Flavihumibacter solisilvae TaxID=1349421 RepID=A0A0C1IRF2_9BACT|nr:SusC/RagA family TonB-linked outer membrane protein [Flavihumibacter solisilvae]KIC93024.1 TonB-dependent receptor [Flavihumibacter solisilvae]
MKFFPCLVVCLLLLFQANGQTTRVITGTVTESSSNDPVDRVSVVLKNTTTGTTTDSKGKFSIAINGTGGILVFTRLGYSPKEIVLDKDTDLQVALTESPSALNDVVVIGYTQQSTKKNTASISKLGPDELKNNPNPNPVQALQGKIAGVSVPISQGQPGIGATNIIIRGGTKPNVYGSGLGNNNGSAVGASDGSNPLVVIDGVFRSMNDVNPDDIESMQVMKDAASTAIYGARGANGVIVIRTKKGKLNSKMTVSLNHRTTWETQARDYDYLSAEEYLRLARVTVANTADPIDKDNLLYRGGFSAGTRVYTKPGEYGKNINLTALYDNILQVEGQQYIDNLLSRGWRVMDDPINPGTKLLYADNQYQDMLWQTGISNNDNITLSGGTDKADYNFSMGYTNQAGIFVGTKYQRYNALGNFGYRASKNLKLDFMVNYQNVLPNYVDAYQNDLVRGIRITPLIRTFKDDGNPMPGELYTVRNRFHSLKYDDMRTATERFVTRVGGDLTITRGLHYKPSFSYMLNDYTELFMRKATPSDEIQPSMQRWKDDYTNNSRQLMIDQVLQYDFSIASDHRFTTLVGMNFTKNTNHTKDMGSQRASNDYIFTIDEPTTTVINGSVFSNVVDFATRLGETRSASFFGQFSYDYQLKYMLGGTLRKDGFSNFAPQNKYALFPSLSAGWNVDRENFWNSKLVNALKLRASWGSAGLSDLSITDTYGNYTSATYAMFPGILRASLSNPNLRWESTVTTDLAIDVSLFNSRINLTVDYYNKLTKDRLTSKPLPSESPFTSIIYNNGELLNRGVEIELGATVIKSGAFRWETNLSFAFNRTTITKLPDNGREKNRQGGGIIYDHGSKSEVEAGGLAEGERPYAIYGYRVLGVFATDEEAAEWNSRIKDNLASPQGIIIGKHGGDFIFDDVNGDGVIDTKDQVFFGYRNPDKIGGIQNTFSYKGISLRVNADYAMGHIISNGALARSLGQGRAFNEGAPTQALGADVWKNQGDAGRKYARFSFADFDFGQRNYLRNAPLGNNSSYNSDVSVMYEKGDFLALREITLSYDLPSHLLKKIYATGLNVFASMYNVAYVTKYSGLNPETYSGFDPGGYPRPRQYSLGANLRF